ncbi:MAG: SagB/ThcOx family dehydrogenase [Lentimicrobiaceae bacterium]|nr:SagB/ThcOx family dehydrogenase [Lentimicrobiaceae bacterium]
MFKPAYILTLICILIMQNLHSQEIKTLPAPEKTGGMPLMQAFNERQTIREIKEGKLSEQQLSNILWAAYGINRTEGGKRTVPTSRNKQEMDVYVALEEGLYLYDAIKHQLIRVLEIDIRRETGEQEFVNIAAVNLIYVADYNRAGSDPESYRNTSSVNTGFMAQNVYLCCASEDLGCVVRGWFNKDHLRDIMGLEGHQEVILTQTVGLKK